MPIYKGILLAVTEEEEVMGAMQVRTSIDYTWLRKKHL